MLFGLWLALSGSCVIAPEEVTGPCSAGTCDDGNPCTKDTCAPDGFCDHEVTNDPPDDGQPCTFVVCADGVATIEPEPDGTKCGLNGGLKCESGQCKCTTKEQCGTDSICATFACTDGACVATHAPNGTDVDPAMEDDCKKNVCNAGVVVAVLDANDYPPDTDLHDCKRPACAESGPIVEIDSAQVPVEDPNPCTGVSCQGDNPVTGTPLPDGTPCSPPPTCGPVASGFEATPQVTCHSGVCDTPVPMSCGLYGCNAEMTACRTTCGADQDCAGNAYCAAPSCTLKLQNGAACTGGNQCITGSCVDGVCCNATCNGTCTSCSTGACLPVTAGLDPDDECAGAAVCNGLGACTLPLGTACSNGLQCVAFVCEDGVCCDNSCLGPCRRCDVAGSVGTCTNVPNGTQAGSCSGTGQVCFDGECKLTNGSACSNGPQCQSGFCSPEPNAQDVCCDQPCNGLCRSCRSDKKQGGVDGICGFIPNNNDVDNECPGGGCQSGTGAHCCNGDGTCQP